jgi:ferritin-like metal-binding protein YciE
MMAIHTLQDLFLHELADCYDAECRFSRALPKMTDAATSGELKKVFQLRLMETEGHLIKLGRVFECFDRKARWKTCEPVMALLRDGECIAASFDRSPAINAALIVSAQKVGHYKLGVCVCLQEWALQLGCKKAALLLREILDEERAAQKVFTILARTLCHVGATVKVVVVVPGSRVGITLVK